MKVYALLGAAVCSLFLFLKDSTALVIWVREHKGRNSMTQSDDNDQIKNHIAWAFFFTQLFRRQVFFSTIALSYCGGYNTWCLGVAAPEEAPIAAAATTGALKTPL